MFSISIILINNNFLEKIVYFSNICIIFSITDETNKKNETEKNETEKNETEKNETEKNEFKVREMFKNYARYSCELWL